MASAAVFCGYATIATTDTAVQLRSTANSVNGGNIIAPLTNLHYVVVGHSTVTDDKTTTTAGYPLAPGAVYPVHGATETDVWYINGKAGDEVYFAFFT